MNLRTLKKLSKRAARYLALLGDKREQFRSERGDNYHSVTIKDRKHWCRTNCHPSHAEGWRQDGALVFTTRAGRRKLMRPPPHPRKGTIMVGSMSGGYQPEWDEESAWSALRNQVWDDFTDWSRLQDERCPIDGALKRDLSTPSLIFAAAAEMVRERRQTP